MDDPKRTARLQRVAIQRLESLQRAGVSQLSRKAAPAKPRRDEAALQRSEVTVRRDEAQQAPPPALTPSKAKAEPQAPSRQIVAATADSLAAIRKEVEVCRRCEHLACARTKTVFGIGTEKPRLCFFGEAPGADEDRTGEPFVGRAGQLLTDIIEKGMKLKRADVYILNVLKCRPPDNRVPTDEEIANCRGYFERQFKILKPEFICCLGATATRALLNTSPSQSLGKMRGKWFDYGDSRVMVTYHPSYLLRNPPAKKDTWEDIQMLMREMGMKV